MPTFNLGRPERPLFGMHGLRFSTYMNYARFQAISRSIVRFMRCVHLRKTIDEYMILESEWNPVNQRVGADNGHRRYITRQEMIYRSLDFVVDIWDDFNDHMVNVSIP